MCGWDGLHFMTNCSIARPYPSTLHHPTSTNVKPALRYPPYNTRQEVFLIQNKDAMLLWPSLYETFMGSRYQLHVTILLCDNTPCLPLCYITYCSTELGLELLIMFWVPPPFESIYITQCHIYASTPAYMLSYAISIGLLWSTSNAMCVDIVTGYFYAVHMFYITNVLFARQH